MPGQGSRAQYLCTHMPSWYPCVEVAHRPATSCFAWQRSCLPLLSARHAFFRLCIRQVFVNTVFLGFLDYERKEVNIPLIQVCFRGAGWWGAPAPSSTRLAGIGEEDLGTRSSLTRAGRGERGRSLAFWSPGAPSRPSGPLREETVITTSVSPAGLHRAEDLGGELRARQLRAQYR